MASIAALGVTSVTPDQSTPIQIATLLRRHWGIKSLHWLRDTVYREDHSTVRTGSGPRVMASLRTLAISALHPSDATTSPKPPPLVRTEHRLRVR